MRVLITGSGGFVGRNLRGHFEKTHDVACPRRAELDLLDPVAVGNYFCANRFDIVIHCAITLDSVENNLRMYHNVVRWCGKFGRMISVGSGAEYDLNHYYPRMTEDYFGEHVPSDIYGFSKYVMALDIETRPRNIYNLRVFAIYGRYENYRRRFISNNICRLLCGLDQSIEKNMVSDYLWVEDFCRIVERFLDGEPAWKSYNICPSEKTDLLGLARIMQAVDGGGKSIRVKQEGFKPEYTGDNGRFLRELGPFEFTPPERAIRDLYHWYRDSGQVVLNPKDFA